MSLWLLLLGCGPAVSPAHSPVQDTVPVEAATSVAAVPAVLPEQAVAYRGRPWCLELRPDGQVVFSDVFKGPKVTLSGPRLADPSSTTVRFRVEQIHRARYVTPCRKHVYEAADLDGHRLNGVEHPLKKPDIRVGEELVVRVEPRDAGEVELCVEDACFKASQEPLVP